MLALQKVFTCYEVLVILSTFISLPVIYKPNFMYKTFILTLRNIQLHLGITFNSESVFNVSVICGRAVEPQRSGILV